MKKFTLFILFLLAFCSSAYAVDWISIAGLALLPMGIITALMLLIGYGFGSQELKMLGQEEIYQFVVTLIMLGIVVAAAEAVNGMAAGEKIQTLAIDSLSSTITAQKSTFNNLRSFGVKLGLESSRSYFCSLSNAGYNIAPCGAFRQLSTPLGLAFQILGLSAAELESLRTLVAFGDAYGLTLILPVGIILRAFKITRGAGGLFIALGISAYIILPISVIAMKEIVVKGKTAALTVNPLPEPACHEKKADDTNYDRAKDLFNSIRNNLPGYLYAFFVEATLTTVVSLFAFITGIRWLSRLTGAEVDVSALMKIA